VFIGRSHKKAAVRGASHGRLGHPRSGSGSRHPAKGSTRRIALLEGELAEACQARDTAEENSQGLSDMAADTK
jgi:hypothetical protein